MFVVYPSGASIFAKDLNSIQTFAVRGNQLVDYFQSATIAIYETDEEALARFDDIITAAGAGAKIYDLREKIGNWKASEEPEKKTTTKRAGRKPAAEKPAAEHNEPAPKK